MGGLLVALTCASQREGAAKRRLPTRAWSRSRCSSPLRASTALRAALRGSSGFRAACHSGTWAGRAPLAGRSHADCPARGTRELRPRPAGL